MCCWGRMHLYRVEKRREEDGDGLRRNENVGEEKRIWWKIDWSLLSQLVSYVISA